MLHHCDQILAVSEFTKNTIIKMNQIPGERITVLNNCLDPYLQKPVYGGKNEALQKRYGLNNYINLVFRKNFSAQVLKANMKIVGNCEYGLVLYRERLPKFRNNGKMIFNCIDWPRDNESEKIHPTQKPVELLKTLIKIFTDEGDVVIDPVAGSGSTLVAAERLNRKSFGFEIKKEFFTKANEWLSEEKLMKKEISELGFAKTKLSKVAPTLWS